MSGNHPKSSPSRLASRFLGLFCTYCTWKLEETKASKGFLLLAHPSGLNDVDDDIGGFVLVFSCQEGSCGLWDAFGMIFILFIFSFPFVYFFWVLHLDRCYSHFYYKWIMICCKACPIAIVILLMLNKQGTFHHTLFVFPNLNIVLMYVSFLFSPFAYRCWFVCTNIFKVVFADLWMCLLWYF